MPRKNKPAPLPTFPCDGEAPNPFGTGPAGPCPNSVQPRRPSESGKHFCPAKSCQVAKQRFYRQRQREQARLEGADVTLRLVADLVRNEREDCAYCGHPQALIGWGHRKAVGSPEACLALGSLGLGLPRGALDIVHPERAPGADG